MWGDSPHKSIHPPTKWGDGRITRYLAPGTRYCPGTGKGLISLISIYSRVPQILPKYLIYPTHPTPRVGGGALGVGEVGYMRYLGSIWGVFGVPGNKD